MKRNYINFEKFDMRQLESVTKKTIKLPVITSLSINDIYEYLARSVVYCLSSPGRIG